MKFAKDDPFYINHEKFFIQEGHTPECMVIPNCDRVRFAAYDGCDSELIARYRDCLEATASLRGLTNTSVLIYPGTIADINNHERVFAVCGNCVFCPGQFYENCRNENAFRDVVATANCLHCLLSVQRLRKGETWVSHSEVVSLAKEIYGQDTADEIKIYFEVS